MQALVKLPDVVVAGAKDAMGEISTMQKAAEKCINGTNVMFHQSQADANELVKKASAQKNLLDSMLAAVAQL